ncbi:S8/S53 family peptidase [Psychroflexus lacisalsi]|uniref:Thrombospondin type 3 repeat-containing protein n=1 Tax=Psychroflexus lacisalsi TaxID=503928 RepID=A0ABN1KAN4_9FLAO|nr:hypothetical protein [Psychroflexus lacisalsi]MBZ9621212.1 hypothetical protein [Psychroflexus lacisalsi]
MRKFLIVIIPFFLLCFGSCSDSENETNDIEEEICDDGIDNDGNGFVDCEDASCSSNRACVESNCEDGIDNDGDGFVDCEDINCEDFQDCLIERCIDGIDNDEDGLIDCDDPDCQSNINCT